MASGEKWDNEIQFKLHLHEYMLRKNMTRTAAIFKSEAGFPDLSAVNVPDSEYGFLQEWWSVFWNSYVKNHSESEADPQAMQKGQSISSRPQTNNRPPVPMVPRASQQFQRSNSRIFDPLDLNTQKFPVPAELTPSSSSSPQRLEHARHNRGNHTPTRSPFQSAGKAHSTVDIRRQVQFLPAESQQPAASTMMPSTHGSQPSAPPRNPSVGSSSYSSHDRKYVARKRTTK